MQLFRRMTNDRVGEDRDELAAELAQLELVQAHNASIQFGAPTRCPACTTYGLVERVDSRNGVVDNRCPTCRTAWRITRRALVAQERPPQASAGIPEGDGVLVRALLQLEPPRPA